MISRRGTLAFTLAIQGGQQAQGANAGLPHDDI